MLASFLYGLGACLIWGTVYVVPILLPESSPLLIALSRYAIFGFFSVLILYKDRHSLSSMSRSDWILALLLGVLGNLLYYWILSEAVVRIGASLAGVFYYLNPHTSTQTAQKTSAKRVPGNRILTPLAAIFFGLALLNAEAILHIESALGSSAIFDFVIGCGFAVASVVIWTWYPLSNARWLTQHRNVPLSLWTAAQGSILLPVSALGLGALSATGSFSFMDLSGEFIFWMFFLGVISSWVGNLLWNRMSQGLPRVLIGQMLVFETLSAVMYSCFISGSPPSATSCFGIFMVLAGVSISLRLFEHETKAPKAPSQQKIHSNRAC